MSVSPPKNIIQFLRWFCRRDQVNYIEGYQLELYYERLQKSGKRTADFRIMIDVLLLFRPSMIQSMEGINQINNYGMIKSYFRIGWRTMLRNKGYSFINIGGLAAGLALVILIGLWIHDELTFNTYHENYDRIARVRVNHNFNGNIQSQVSLPFPLSEDLRSNYPEFDKVSVCTWSYSHFLSYNEDRFSKEGMFVEPDFLELMSIRMTRGSSRSLADPGSIVLTESLARTIFGNEDPVGKTLKIDLQQLVTVTGVFADLPKNNYFAPTLWLANIETYMNAYVNPRMRTHWGDFSYQVFASVREGVSFDAASGKIKDLIVNKDERARESNPALFLQPMWDWHLYNEYKDGINVGGEITFVWLFGTIGGFVLLLACINFMNLSTARSESRAKEIGLRKTIGSLRSQLVLQFLSESILVVTLAFILAMVLVIIALPTFNLWTAKEIAIPYREPLFWTAGVAFILGTGIIAGSYPALFLSSFNTVSILKGTFRLGWFSGFSRKSLVIVQFVVSVTLVIGTITVYHQIQFARSRPIGYDKNGLITTYGYPFSENPRNPATYDGLRHELMATGAVTNMGKSTSPTTATHSFQSDFDWEGRDPQMLPNIGVVWCTHDYGKTIEMQIIQGRDFSRDVAGDTASIVLNEAAVDYMGLTDPVGTIVRYNQQPFEVIGIARNMLTDSPYNPVGPLVMMIGYRRSNIITMKLNQERSVADNLAAIEPVFRKFRPDVTFEIQFIDDQFARKFEREERVGKISSAFTVFAILISCLGLFGLASFVAQQRTREIGIRKVAGATIWNIWSMLSRDFIILVVAASIVASPLAWYMMTGWLEQFTYKAPLSVWIFAGSGLGAVFLTLFTVSFQSIRAARANPIHSLRSE